MMHGMDGRTPVCRHTFLPDQMAAEEPWCWCAPPIMPLHRPSAPSELMALSGSRLASPYQSSDRSLSAAAAGFTSMASCSVRPPNGNAACRWSPRPAAYRRALSAWHSPPPPPPPGMPMMPAPAKCASELALSSAAAAEAAPPEPVRIGSNFQSSRPRLQSGSAAAVGGSCCCIPAKDRWRPVSAMCRA
uniref:Uncharacterized protein n=1 Tax=Arundo donax TaxID=35708 RepID=A0A0A9AIH6_ARUDO